MAKLNRFNIRSKKTDVDTANNTLDKVVDVAEDVTEGAIELGKVGASGTVGGGFGYVTWKIGKWQSDVAMKTHSGLKDLSFWDACVSDDFGHWLYASHPTFMLGLHLTVGAIVGIGAYYTFKD
jgi:hypothetical protein